MQDTPYSGTLRFAINLGNPVLAFTNANGMLDGISVELAKKLADRLHCQAEFIRYHSAGDVVRDADSGPWDVAFLARDPKREEKLYFTDSYITIEGTALVHENSPYLSAEDIDAQDNVINVGKDAAYDLWLTRHLKQASLNRLGSSQEAIDAFLSGQGTMAAGIRQPLERVADTHSGYRVLEGYFAQIHQAVCVPHRHTQYIDDMREMISRMTQSGELSEVISRNMKESRG